MPRSDAIELIRIEKAWFNPCSQVVLISAPSVRLRICGNLPFCRPAQQVLSEIPANRHTPHLLFLSYNHQSPKTKTIKEPGITSVGNVLFFLVEMVFGSGEDCPSIQEYESSVTHRNSFNIQVHTNFQMREVRPRWSNIFYFASSHASSGLMMTQTLVIYCHFLRV